MGATQLTLVLSSLICAVYQVSLTAFRFMTLDVYNTAETVGITLFELILGFGLLSHIRDTDLFQQQKVID